ncbi:MAG: 50S ribosomal protein L32 [Candidatus Omnitrophica bacterium]|nr:50S ribosomal protein L32 [Candidatus Omnitrophota bacterium]
MPKVKHRHSKSRGRKRRTHWKLDEPALVKCSQCGKERTPHQVCPYCGYYKGKKVMHVETLEERRDRRDKRNKRAK